MTVDDVVPVVLDGLAACVVSGLHVHFGPGRVTSNEVLHEAALDPSWGPGKGKTGGERE